jgi:eukaryotic-like serine/threonine-protein kinase
VSANDLKKLGRYEIKGVLGKGAMGLVYDGLDPTLNRRVAIKTILTRNLDAATAKQYAMRFQREVRAVARINHPNIVQVYDFGQDGDLAFIVMEYIEGKELKDAFDRKELFDLGTTFRLMGELLSALDLAHEAGVIHRDIKPANLMLLPGLKLKVMDFGIARLANPPQGKGLTEAGTSIGTPDYMSPEQLSGAELDPRSDLYAAGVVLFECLTGRVPFEAETTWALVAKHLEEETPDPRSLNADVPADLALVILKAMAKAPADRYATAAEMHDALAKLG